MNRDTLRPLVLAVLAVLAVALVSATVTSVTEPGDPGPAQGDTSGDEAAGSDPGLAPSLSEGDSIGNQSQSGAASGATCIKELDDPWVQLAVIAGLALVLGLVWYRQDGLAALGVGAILIPVVGLVFAAAGCSGFDPVTFAGGGGEPVQPSDSTGAQGGDGATTDVAFDAPLWILLVAGGLVVALAVVTVSRAGGVDGLFATLGSGDDGEEEPLPETDAAAVGRVAGAAADRIESGVGAENEVYRAWASMTEHLEVSRPESSTPAEFADAAVEAGLEREDVEELTRLFESVRYGGAAPTADREERAVDALRRIEAYADEETPTDDSRRRPGESDDRRAGR